MFIKFILNKPYKHIIRGGKRNEHTKQNKKITIKLRCSV